MAGQRLYALTICAFRKVGMGEDEYHNYLSQHHSQLVKSHLTKAGIVGYTMTHNTSGTKNMMTQIFGNLPEGRTADYDCFIQILFRDVEDYIRVKEDPYYQNVIFLDHANFADPMKTTFVTGWVENHVVDGKII